MRVDNRRRSGVVLICVLACALIAITLGACAIQLSLRSMRASQRKLAIRQTEWLLDAGIQRSLEMIAEGEIADAQWELPATVLPTGEARIVIDFAESSTEVQQVVVTAEYRLGEGPEMTFRRSHSYDLRPNDRPKA